MRNYIYQRGIFILKEDIKRLGYHYTDLLYFFSENAYLFSFNIESLYPGMVYITQWVLYKSLFNFYIKRSDWKNSTG